MQVLSCIESAAINRLQHTFVVSRPMSAVHRYAGRQYEVISTFSSRFRNFLRNEKQLLTPRRSWALIITRNTWKNCDLSIHLVFRFLVSTSWLNTVLRRIREFDDEKKEKRKWKLIAERAVVIFRRTVLEELHFSQFCLYIQKPESSEFC